MAVVGGVKRLLPGPVLGGQPVGSVLDDNAVEPGRLQVAFQVQVPQATADPRVAWRGGLSSWRSQRPLRSHHDEPVDPPSVPATKLRYVTIADRRSPTPVGEVEVSGVLDGGPSGSFDGSRSARA